jgi:hypothetical protein
VLWSTDVFEHDQSRLVVCYGRAGDPAGADEQDYIRLQDRGAAAALFATSLEATTRPPYLAAPCGRKPLPLMIQVYESTFGLEPEAPAVALWADRLPISDGSASTIGAFIAALIDSASGTDRTLPFNKLAVASDITLTKIPMPVSLCSLRSQVELRPRSPQPILH